VNDLAHRAVQSNVSSFLAVCSGSPGGRVLSGTGVLAIATPAAPERPLFNAAFGAVAERYDQLEAFFADARVDGWTAFVDPADERSASELARRGHVLDGEPRVMAADAAAVAEGPVGELELAAEPTAAMAAALNDAVYGYPGSFARTLRSLDGLHAVVALAGGAPAACALAHEVGGDCHITCVATLPEHRGRGLAGMLVRRLVRDGIGRGCDTTSLVATRAGAGVYSRLGYRDLGHLEMWERRSR
jgi:ribosomal protein S18 acetylase RimI-like enzyme